MSQWYNVVVEILSLELFFTDCEQNRIVNRPASQLIDSWSYFFMGYFNGDDDVFSTIKRGQKVAERGIRWYNIVINKQ